MCSSHCRCWRTLCQSCIIHPFWQHNKQLVYFTLTIIEILKVAWLIEWEIHVGGVLHHSSPPSTKRLWHISLEAPAASPLLSVHNLMAAVTAQLIHDGPLSSIPITSFSDSFDIHVRLHSYAPSPFPPFFCQMMGNIVKWKDHSGWLWFDLRLNQAILSYVSCCSVHTKNKTVKHLKIRKCTIIDVTLCAQIFL